MLCELKTFSPPLLELQVVQSQFERTYFRFVSLALALLLATPPAFNCDDEVELAKYGGSRTPERPSTPITGCNFPPA